MLDRNYLFEVVNRYNFYRKEEILDHILNNTPALGKEVYVIYKERKTDPYVIATGTITSTRLRSDGSKSFSVEGKYTSRWRENHYYQGSFSLSAVGKKVFFDKEKALEEAERLNRKLKN